MSLKETHPLERILIQSGFAELPNLRKTVQIEFYSLRNGIGPNLGIIPDVDTKIRREAYRVKISGGWKWQIKGLHKIAYHDPCVYTDQDILDEYGAELEVKILTESSVPHRINNSV